LALVGGLAALALVRLAGVVLLGAPRSEMAAEAHESSPWMLGPIWVLVVLCLTVAVIPQAATGLLAGAADQVLGFDPGQTLEELEATQAPLSIIGSINLWVLLAGGAAAALLLVRTRQAVRTHGPTWGCGYVAPTPRMQYTGRSFVEMTAEHLVPRFLRPRTSREVPQGLFPTKTRFACESPDPVS